MISFLGLTSVRSSARLSLHQFIHVAYRYLGFGPVPLEKSEDSPHVVGWFWLSKSYVPLNLDKRKTHP